MQLTELVNVSAQVAPTRSRLEKRGPLRDALRATGSEVDAVLANLAGEP